MAGRISDRLPLWVRVWLVPWALLWSAGLLVLAIAALSFGMPHVRVGSDGYTLVRGYPNTTVCTYLGPLGPRELVPGRDVAHGCPVFALFEWEEPRAWWEKLEEKL